MKQQSEEEEPGAEHDHKASQERALSEREQSHGDSSTADFSVCNQVQGWSPGKPIVTKHKSTLTDQVEDWKGTTILEKNNAVKNTDLCSSCVEAIYLNSAHSTVVLKRSALSDY